MHGNAEPAGRDSAPGRQELRRLVASLAAGLDGDARFASPVQRTLIVLAMWDAGQPAGGALDRIGVSFVRGGGVDIGVHGGSVGAVEALAVLVGLPVRAEEAREHPDEDSLSWTVRWSTAAHLRGGVSVCWFTDEAGVASLNQLPEFMHTFAPQELPAEVPDLLPERGAS